MRTRLLVAGAAATLAVCALPADASKPPPLPDLASVEQVVGAPATGATGAGIDVALVDTGVTPVQGLANGKVVYGPDVSFDGPGDHANVDGYGHGTAMAGVIAGNDGVAGGYTGIAPDARIVSVKAGASTGAVDVSQMIAAIDWVTAHAHDAGLNIRVLNLSLGTDSTQRYQVDPLAAAAERAWRAGIVVVVAVGNDGRDTDAVADPAIDPYVLAVGAEDPKGTVDPSDDKVATFSQKGNAKRAADLVAPGTYVMGLASPGSALVTANPGAVYGGRFLRGSGTSQAAAVTSGVVADLLSARPDLTPDQVKGALTSTALPIQTPNPKFVGSGLVQLAPALSVATTTDVQAFKPARGTGSLEEARGTSHVSLDGVQLAGEQDIFGTTWSGTTWSGTTWSGTTWSGTTWSGTTWSGTTWSGTTWSGTTWSGTTWSGTTWSGTTWSGDSWLGATWN